MLTIDSVQRLTKMQRSGTTALPALGCMAGIAVCAGYVVHYYGAAPKFSSPAEWSQFGGSVASISVTMLGFMLAALAVLASINHTKLVAGMRKTGHYTELLVRLFAGCTFFLFCALSGFAVMFGVPVSGMVFPVIAGLHVAALLALLDIGSKFWLVLRNLE